MLQVKLKYNAFSSDMTIDIDGRPVPRISRITQCYTQKFEAWCVNICDLIASEVNDKYVLEYIGRSCEARILGQFARDNASCEKFFASVPILSDSVLIRLKKLSSYVQSGLSCERSVRMIHVYTDLQDDAIGQILQKSMPKLSFCNIKVCIHALEELEKHSDLEPAYIIVFDTIYRYSLLHLKKLKTSQAVLIYADDNVNKLEMIDNVFVEHISENNFIMLFEQYLELWTFVDILKTTLGSISLSKDNPMYLQIKALDKQEPVTQVLLPSSIEYGKVEEIIIYTIPSGVLVDNIEYKISDDSVINLTPNGLKAVGEGEAVVEAYIRGRSTKIASKKILCYRRNRIQELQLNAEHIELLVGDKFSFSCTYSPNNADDADSITFSSSNGIIAAISEKNSVKARNPGQCVIYANSEQASASCVVKIYPRLQEIKLNVHSIDTEVKRVVKIFALRIPDDATLQQLKYRVSPSSLGRYEPSAKGFYAEKIGKGELIISTQDGSVSKRIPINVKSEREEQKLNIKVIIAIVVSIVALLYLLLKG